MKTLSFAPEIPFKNTIDGVDYFQANLMWKYFRTEGNPMMPVRMLIITQYLVTIAVKNDRYSIHLLHPATKSLGAEYGDYSKEKFEELWRELVAKLESQQSQQG